MPTLPELVAEIVRLLLQPALLGVIVLGMAVARELYPRWHRTSLRRVIYDLLLLALAGVLVVLVALRVAG